MSTHFRTTNIIITYPSRGNAKGFLTKILFVRRYDFNHSNIPKREV
jgi:hypothetical protein